MYTYASVDKYVFRAPKIHWLLPWFVGTTCCGFHCLARVSEPLRVLNCNRETWPRYWEPLSTAPRSGTHVNQRLAHRADLGFGSDPFIRLEITDLDLSGRDRTRHSFLIYLSSAVDLVKSKVRTDPQYRLAFSLRIKYVTSTDVAS